jgi:hypothetical protein
LNDDWGAGDREPFLEFNKTFLRPDMIRMTFHSRRSHIAKSK